MSNTFAGSETRQIGKPMTDVEFDAKVQQKLAGRNEKVVLEYHGYKVCDFYSDAAADIKKYCVYDGSNKVADNLPSVEEAKARIDKMGGGKLGAAKDRLMSGDQVDEKVTERLAKGKEKLAGRHASAANCEVALREALQSLSEAERAARSTNDSQLAAMVNSARQMCMNAIRLAQQIMYEEG